MKEMGLRRFELRLEAVRLIDRHDLFWYAFLDEPRAPVIGAPDQPSCIRSMMTVDRPGYTTAP